MQNYNNLGVCVCVGVWVPEPLITCQEGGNCQDVWDVRSHSPWSSFRD